MLKVMKSKITNNSLVISFLVCLLSVTLTARQALAEYELKVSTYETGLIQNSLGATEGIRIVFLDLSDAKSIYLTEIGLDGSVLSRVPLLPNTLAVEEKVREALYYRKSTDSYFLGWHGKGVYEFDRQGNQQSFIKTPPLTHDIHVDDNGVMTFAHSWSNEREPQAFQVDKTGKVLWQWNAKKFIKANKFKKSENRKEPENFAAATSAVPVGKDKVAVTLSAWNVVAIVEKKSNKVVKYISDTRRPHSVVVSNNQVIGYTSRSMSGLRKHGPGNSLVVYDDKHKMFSRTFADGVKSLDLQYLGNGLWLLPNGPNILIMDSEGIVYWQLDLENYLYLDGARFSFTNAILIGNDKEYKRPNKTFKSPGSDAVCKFTITAKKFDKRNKGRELARLAAGYISQKGPEIKFHIQTGWGFNKKRKDLLTNKQQLKIKGNELSGSLQVFSNYKDIEDSIKNPVKGTLKAKLKNGLLQNGDFPLKAKSGYSTKTMNFKLSECNTK
ncbi:hypothetical protein N8500_11285 [Candidatus Puniceispirillum sp.]|nr:hypothetical protein [Candidatus Puniceispirillum sp.]